MQMQKMKTHMPKRQITRPLQIIKPLKASIIDQLNTVATNGRVYATGITTFVMIYCTLNWASYYSRRKQYEKENKINNKDQGKINQKDKTKNK